MTVYVFTFPSWMQKKTIAEIINSLEIKIGFTRREVLLKSGEKKKNRDQIFG